MLLTIDALDAYLATINPDLIILQNLTFANGAYASQVLAAFTSCPILLWSLREPVIDGGRLRLNSLTGGFSASNVYHQFRQEPLNYIYGGPAEEAVRRKLCTTLAAASLKKALTKLKLAVVGHTPQGFGFGRAMDVELLKLFGVRQECIEARELIDVAKGFTDEDVQPYLQKAMEAMVGLDATPEKNRLDFARLYKAYLEFAEANSIGAMASRCWPDFFTAFGTPVCAVMALLNDAGIATACETDAYGALSMYCGQYLTGQPAFFGDPVSLDEEANTLTFWHCGTGACSLARQPEGASVGVHCNRKIGPTLEFGCKPCEAVTIFRIGRDGAGRHRFFIASGKALDKPQQFYGASVVVELKGSAEGLVYGAVEAGWEPHFAVIYGDVAQELKLLADMLGLPAELH